MVWQNCLGIANPDIVYGIYCDSSQVYVCGSSDTQGYPYGFGGSYDAVLWILDISGIFKDVKYFGGNKLDVANTICRYSDTTLAIIGRSNSANNMVGKNYGMEDVWLFFTDTAGNFISGIPLGDSQTDQGIVLKSLSNNRLMFVAYTNSTGGMIPGNYGQYDAWFGIIDYKLTGLPDSHNDSHPFLKVFPNPLFDKATIRCSEQVNGKILIWNVIGQYIETVQMLKGMAVIEKGNKPPGQYIFRIINEDGEQVKTSKILVR